MGRCHFLISLPFWPEYYETTDLEYLNIYLGTEGDNALVVGHVSLLTGRGLGEAEDHLSLEVIAAREVQLLLESVSSEVAVVLEVAAVALSLKERPSVHLSHTVALVRPEREVSGVARERLLLALDQLAVLEEKSSAVAASEGLQLGRRLFNGTLASDLKESLGDDLVPVVLVHTAKENNNAAALNVEGRRRLTNSRLDQLNELSIGEDLLVRQSVDRATVGNNLEERLSSSLGSHGN